MRRRNAIKMSISGLMLLNRIVMQLKYIESIASKQEKNELINSRAEFHSHSQWQ